MSYQFKIGDRVVEDLLNREHTIIEVGGPHDPHRYLLSNGWWYAESSLTLVASLVKETSQKTPAVPKPTIQAAWVVENITFMDRNEAVDHLLGINLHNELKKVFGGALNCSQEAILETLVMKLVKDKETFKEIFDDASA